MSPFGLEYKQHLRDPRTDPCGTPESKCSFLLRYAGICQPIKIWSRREQILSLDVNIPDEFEGFCDEWCRKQRIDRAGLVLPCIPDLMLQQCDDGPSGSRSPWSDLYRRRLAASEYTNGLPSVRQPAPWRIFCGNGKADTVVLQHAFIQIRPPYHLSISWLSEIHRNPRINQWFVYDSGNQRQHIL